MAQTIQLKRGLKSALPTTGMSAGEPHWTTDRGTLHVAVDATNRLPLVPPIDDLTTLASVDGAADFVMIHDASEASGQKEKKMTFNAFKTALNIPAASTDEQVAATNGSNAGYLDEVLVSSAGTLTFTVSTDDLDADIADGGVDTVHLATNAVTTVKITDLNVTTAKLAANAVTTAKITDSNVTTAKIADNAVTAAKIADGFLDLDAAVFSGTGIDTELTIDTIDGGTF